MQRLIITSFSGNPGRTKGFKRWPYDTAIPGYVYNCILGSIAYSLSLLPSHRPDITYKKFWKGHKIASHLSKYSLE